MMWIVGSGRPSRRYWVPLGDRDLDRAAEINVRVIVILGHQRDNTLVSNFSIFSKRFSRASMYLFVFPFSEPKPTVGKDGKGQGDSPLGRATFLRANE